MKYCIHDMKYCNDKSGDCLDRVKHALQKKDCKTFGVRLLIKKKKKKQQTYI